jgi:hypothetical protein
MGILGTLLLRRYFSFYVCYCLFPLPILQEEQATLPLFYFRSFMSPSTRSVRNNKSATQSIIALPKGPNIIITRISHPPYSSHTRLQCPSQWTENPETVKPQDQRSRAPHWRPPAPSPRPCPRLIGATTDDLHDKMHRSALTNQSDVAAMPREIRGFLPKVPHLRQEGKAAGDVCSLHLLRNDERFLPK